ncbi:MAG: DUF2267 domain-containing protein [Candidatus Nitrosoglobus sp.]|jgi:uncharacterized protein (DUF2267 family)
MSTAGVEAFDSTLQKTSQWLDDLMADMDWQDRQQAYSTLRAVLHVLRDRLTAEEAADLGAQLPMLIRGFYYDGWRPADKPLKYRRKEEFLDQVNEKYQRLQGMELERAVNTVFKILSKYVTEGEIEDIKSQLPPEVRALWV